ncbi:Uncharacterised protein [Gordonia bronchialis]|nr:Uncharacterised protein [Gordonia bronchialis]
MREDAVVAGEYLFDVGGVWQVQGYQLGGGDGLGNRLGGTTTRLDQGGGLDDVRLYPTTVCPARARLIAMGLPMTPSPMNPIVAMGYSCVVSSLVMPESRLPSRRCQAGSVRTPD